MKPHTPKRSLEWIFSGVILSALLSCSVEAPDTFEPLFSGMPQGEFIARNCVRIDGFTVQKKRKSAESELRVYTGNACNGATAHRATLTGETLFAGVWNHYLVLDHGTGADSREIELIDLTEAKKHFRTAYVRTPEFSGESLSYYKPTGETVSPESCETTPEKAQTWAQKGLDVGKATKMTFRSGTAGATVEPETTCYPIQ
ncbi:hypothetical protein [Marinimicrobium locisalis]|uniref:hypothetical protein n=1 Tax=Marinimicrobium locisalis TaxID=546022 RepID=UPI003221BE69